MTKKTAPSKTVADKKAAWPAPVSVAPPTAHECQACGIRNGMSDAQVAEAIAAYRAAHPAA